MDYDYLVHSEVGMNIIQYVFNDSYVPQDIAAALSGYLSVSII